jgi:hypothetical protein
MLKDPKIKIRRFSDVVVEKFDPMVGIDNFLNNPAMIALVTYWLLDGRYSFTNIKSTGKNMKDSFIEYCNYFGYQIDKDALDYRFNEIVDKVKNIIKV